MINGIPYFKEYNNEIRETILNSKIAYKMHTDIYSLVNSDDCINNKLVVVIDNKWLTYLSDIQFNYRDINCSLPYFTYELYEMEYNGRSNNKGHLIVDIGKHTTYVRYNYTLQNIQINIGTQVEIYNLRTQEKVLITITDWTNSNTFKLHVLHNLYLKSSYADDNMLTTEFKKRISLYK